MRRLLYSWMDSRDGRWYSTVIFEWRLLDGEWYGRWLSALCEDDIGSVWAGLADGIDLGLVVANNEAVRGGRHGHTRRGSQRK